MSVIINKSSIKLELFSRPVSLLVHSNKHKSFATLRNEILLVEAFVYFVLYYKRFTSFC